MQRIVRASFEAFQNQMRELAAHSDILDFEPIDLHRSIVRFRCSGMVRDSRGDIREADRFDVGFFLPESYLRYVRPEQLITIIGPAGVWHPNIRVPYCCIGAVAPGTPLIDLVYRVYELLTCQSIMPDERDALNPLACRWARRNLDRFPLDVRPLKRRGRVA